MFRGLAALIISGLLLINIYGCVALLAGAAGGAGTAAWLSGKLSQDVNAPFERTVKAAGTALESFKFHIEKETVKDNVAQLISRYGDGREIWIDVRRITDSSSKIEVRVGATGDKKAAQRILDRINHYL
jgi:alkylated DNA nucleotide flippase Atl1